MMSRKALWHFLLPVVASTAALRITDCYSAAFDIQSSLQSSISYADNITLAGNGNEEDETVLMVTPGVGVSARGSRAEINLNYSVDGLYYFNVPERSNARQNLQGRAQATLIEDRAFIEGTGLIRTQEIDPRASAGLGNLAVTEGVGQVSTWTLRPYLVHRFGGSAVARADLGLDYVDYPGAVSDSFGREYKLSVQSGPQAMKLTWGAQARTKQIYNSGEDADYSILEYELSLRYRLVSEWALVGSAGYLKYDYPADPTIARLPDGSQWRLGVSWTPTQRTEIEVGVGEHFFGPLRYGRLINRTRNVYTEFSYDKQISSNRDIQISVSEPIFDPNTNQQVGGGQIVRSETEQIFVSERTRFLMSYLSPKIEFGIQFNNEHRFFEITSGDETVYGGIANFRWKVSSRTSWVVSYENRVIRDVNGVNDTLRTATYAMEKKLSPKTDFSADLQRVDRNSESPTVTDYIAHVATLRLRTTF